VKKILPVFFLFVHLFPLLSKAQCGTCNPVVFGNDSSIQYSVKDITYDNATPFDTIIYIRFPRFPKNQQLFSSSTTTTEVLSVDFTGNYVHLPYDMHYEFSNGGFYNVAAGDTTGCLRLCCDNCPPQEVYYNLTGSVVRSGFANTGSGVFDTLIDYTGVYGEMHITGHYNDPWMSFEIGNSNLKRPFRTCDQSNLYPTALIHENCFDTYQWQLDWQNVGTGSQYQFDTTPLPMGNHSLSLITDMYDVFIKDVTVHTYPGLFYDTSGGYQPDIYLKMDDGRETGLIMVTMIRSLFFRTLTGN